VHNSLQLTSYHKVAPPTNWYNGDECVIVPSVSNDEIPNLLPKGHSKTKPYLRIMPQQNLE
jgi:hypothetical protein